MDKHHLLMIGTGSIGQRHARNFSALGCDISGMDPRPDRLAETNEQVPLRGMYSSLTEAFAKGKDITAVVVNSPTSFHVDQAIAALGKGLPVLLEKPVAKDLESGRRLQKIVEEAKAPLLLGYTWRWWPPLLQVKKLLNEEVVGKLRHVRFIMSAHLADWHPWEKYQEFFMSNEALGGGALLDESHWLDLMVWFFGMPEKLLASVEKISDLDIETDDNVDMLLYYPDNLRVSMHLDLYSRPHERSIQFVGEEGTLVWSSDPNSIAIGKGMEKKWQVEEFRYERNDMFVGVAREFLEVLQGKPARTCTINDGVKVLTLIEAARQSNRLGKMVEIAGTKLV
ncbi:MAG: Gfo/Idh/MocA family protein [Desulfobaccales bacterium]